MLQQIKVVSVLTNDNTMNPYYFLSLLLFIPLITSYAQEPMIEHGFDYDTEIISNNPDGSQTIHWSSHFPRILNNQNEYVDYIYSENTNMIQIETFQGSVVLDKNTCGFSYFNQNRINPQDIPLLTDSIIPRRATNGTDTWININQLIDASCQTSWDGQSLTAKKTHSVGVMEYKYIFTGKKWKTQLEVTNLSGLEDQKFGFIQTFDLNKDLVNFGGQQRNLDNFDGQTFGRTFLENNEANVIDFLNSKKFDFDQGFDNLWSIGVYDTGIGKSKLAFDYSNNAQVLPNLQTFVIDPSYGATSGTYYRVFSGLFTSADCDSDNSYTKDTTINSPQFNTAGSSGRCHFATVQWDLSLLPSSITISNPELDWDTGAGDAVYNCDIVEFDEDTTTASANTIKSSLIANINTASEIVSNNDFCEVSNTNSIVNIPLGSGGSTAIENDIDSDGLFTIGAGIVDFTRTSDPDGYIATDDVQLSFDYTTSPNPDAINDLTSTGVTQTTIGISFSQPGLNGAELQSYMVNYTTPTGNPTTVYDYINTTSTTLTGLTLGTDYSIRVTAVTQDTFQTNITSGIATILNVTTPTFNPPGNPTLGSIALSDTAIRFTSVRGTTGSNSTIWYGFQCELNGVGWTTVVANSSLPSPSIYEYTGLSLGDVLICQWRDGSVDGWSGWSNNATDTLELTIIQNERPADADHLKQFEAFIDSMGGIYFGMSLFPMVIMFIGFMAGKKTVRIFTLITLFLMGIVHASGYYVYPDWYWGLSLLLGLGLVLGRQRSD